MTRSILVVFLKEVVDNLRDRRSLALALVYPLMGPILVAVLMGLMSRVLVAEPERGQVVIAVSGGDQAPDLMALLDSHGVTVRPPPLDPANAVMRGLYPAVLIIPKGFQQTLAAGGQVELQLISDSSKLVGQITSAQISGMLHGFGLRLSRERLAASGVDPALAEPMKLVKTDVSGRGQITSLFLSMVPPFVVFTVFIGGVYLAIDSTSGERERGSLEPLLANPVRRWELMLGKFLAALVFTMVALGVQLAAFDLVFHSGAARLYGLTNMVGWATYAALFLLGLPMMILATAVQVVLAAVTRSFKEAQTYLGLLPLVPSMAGLALVFVPVQPSLWLMAVPVFGETVLMSRVLRGEALGVDMILVAVVANLVLGGLLTLLAARLYDREELLFGG